MPLHLQAIVSRAIGASGGFAFGFAGKEEIMTILIRAIIGAALCAGAMQSAELVAQPRTQAGQPMPQPQPGAGTQPGAGMMGPHGQMMQSMPHDPAMMANCQTMHTEMTALREEMARLRAEMQKKSRSR